MNFKQGKNVKFLFNKVDLKLLWKPHFPVNGIELNLTLFP